MFNPVSSHINCPSADNDPLQERIETFASMAETLNDQFIKPLTGDRTEALDVLKNLAKSGVST